MLHTSHLLLSHELNNILPLLYGCETCSVTRREERRLRTFENTILRIIAGPKEEMTGEWRILHKEELQGLYSLINIVRLIKSRRNRWKGNVARIGGRRDAYRVVGKLKGNKQLLRPNIR